MGHLEIGWTLGTSRQQERLIGAASKTVVAREGHPGFESLSLRHA